MRKILRFVLTLAIISGVAIFLANQPGTARVVWHGMIIESSAATLFFAALLVGFVFYRLWRFTYFLRHGRKHRTLDRHVHKLQKGHDWLTQGLVAVAGGDASEASRMAIAARKHLGTTAATQLLEAQAAQLAGDDKTAASIFRELTQDPDAAVIGYRGLIMAARRSGNFAEMETLADALHQIRPDTPWLNLVLFDIAAKRRDWDKASAALAEPAMGRLMGPEKIRQARAAVLILRAGEETRKNNPDKALQAAEQAARQAPDWLPAVLTLTRQQLESGHERAARRTVEKNWSRMPHPQLAALYRTADADAIDHYRHVECLCRANREASMSHYIQGEAALDAGLWGEARRHFSTLITHQTATQSVYRMLAKLERQSPGDEQAALHWLMKSVDAPPDPQWLCSACGGMHKDWQPVCTHCGAFITLDWQSPGTSRALGGSTGYTPLLLNDWME